MTHRITYPGFLAAALAAIGLSVCFAAPASLAQETAAAKPQTGEPKFSGYDPSPVYPNGRPHPMAPAELDQFHFMIGENACLDRIRQADGSYREFPTRWNAKYALNGFAIQDQYWADSFATTNLRIFDPKSGTWKVTFARMPGYFVGTWEGKMEGDDMVLRRIASEQGPKRPSTGRLVFFEIGPGGFEWKAESLDAEGKTVINWMSSCRKVN